MKGIAFAVVVLAIAVLLVAVWLIRRIDKENKVLRNKGKKRNVRR